MGSRTTGDVPAALCHAPLRPDWCTFLPIETEDSQISVSGEGGTPIPGVQQPLQKPVGVRASRTPATCAILPRRVAANTPLRARGSPLPHQRSPLQHSSPSSALLGLKLEEEDTHPQIEGHSVTLYTVLRCSRLARFSSPSARSSTASPLVNTSPTSLSSSISRSLTADPDIDAGQESAELDISPTPSTAVALGEWAGVLPHWPARASLKRLDSCEELTDLLRAPIAVRPFKRRRSPPLPP